MEQWWRMNKASNFTEFYLLKMKALPGYNIGYAIRMILFYISRSTTQRTPGYDWEGVVLEHSKTLWTETYDIEEL